jgi:RNA polymerase sigma-70 factor (ECF subfamily)
MHDPTSAPDDVPAALQGLLQQRAWVRSLALVLARDSNAADDLEQDTWARAIERPPARGGTPRAWLATVMRRLRSDDLRGEGRRRRREEAAARPEAEPSAADRAACAEAHRRVVDAVLALPPADRDLVLERWWEGREPSVIAARLGVPASTVRSRLARAVERLRADLTGGRDGDRAAHWLGLLIGEGAPPPCPRGSTVATVEKASLLVLGAALLIVVGSFVLQSDETTPTEVAVTTPSAIGGSPTDGRPIVAPEAPAAADEEPPPRNHDPAAPAAAASASPAERGVLTVTVRDAAGEPVEGAVLTVFREGGDKFEGEWRPMPGAGGSTGADGVLRLVLPGDATPVDAPSSPGGEDRPEGKVDPLVAPRCILHAREGDRAAFSASILMGVEGGVADLVLLPTVTHSGRVVDEKGSPIVGAAVTLFVPVDNRGRLVFAATTDFEGAYALPGCPPQKLGEDDRSFRAVFPGLADGWVTLAPGGVGPVEIVLVQSLQVRGRCIDREGRPVAGVNVIADGVDGTWTDAEGKFVLPGLLTGAMELRLFPDGHAARGVPLPPGDGVAMDLGDLVLEDGVPLRGTVVDERGAPVKGASLNLLALDVAQYVGYSGTDDEGAFLLKHLGPGEHEVHVSAPAGADGFGRRARVQGVRGGGEPLRIVVTAGLGVRLDFVDAVTGKPVLIRSLQIAAHALPDGPMSNQGMSSDSGVTSMELDLESAVPHRLKISIPGKPPIETTVTPHPDQGVAVAIEVP